MNHTTKYSIEFRLQGNELDEESGYDLYYLSQNLHAFQQLIDKTYTTLKNDNNNKRENLRVKVHNIRSGSFLADIYIEVAMVMGSLLPIVTEVNAKTIWDTAKLSFEYLKAILNANRRGESLSTVVTESSNVNIVNSNGDVIISVHPDVIRVANQNYPTFKKIASLINEKGEEFTKATFKPVNSEIENAIEIGVEEKVLLQNKSIIEEEPIRFKGKIFKADAEKLNGKMKVYGNSSIIEDGEYNFEFLDKSKIIMKDYFDVECEFLALKQTEFKPDTLNKYIKQLKIISVEKL